MPATKNFSSSLPPKKSLIAVAIERLHLHPANPNVMAEDLREKLARNIKRQGRYPPLIVRPYPGRPGEYQVIDGAQRFDVLPELGYREILCFVWPCDDAEALLLIATLNRLHGEDIPRKRAELIAEIRGLLPAEALHELLPEDAGAIDDLMSLLDLDSEALLAELTAASERGAASAPRLISFVVLREDEEVIEAAIAQASSGLNGQNRRGRALALLCRRFMECGDA